ncbi:hypothetical protein P8452_36860 [Trifolium repens]|nr:hypothetical protein P8452_36860 [Trifolium repens]
MYDCLLRLVNDPGKRTKADHQLEDLKARKGKFGSEFATYALETKTATHAFERVHTKKRNRLKQVTINKHEEDEGDDISLDVGQDASIGDVLSDDLELPPIDEEDDDDHDDFEVEDNEDEEGDLDDYQDFGLEDILNVQIISFVNDDIE